MKTEDLKVGWYLLEKEKLLKILEILDPTKENSKYGHIPVVLVTYPKNPHQKLSIEFINEYCTLVNPADNPEYFL